MVLDRFGIKGSGRPSTLAFAFDACGFERTDTLMHEKEKLFEQRAQKCGETALGISQEAG
jgi:hypothetical protein